MNFPFRLSWAALLILALFGGALLMLYGYPLPFEEGEPTAGISSGSNLAFFLLININILVVLILGFLVAKNVVKLLLDRRRNIFGSRLRVKLVLAFVGLTLVPTVLLFLIAKGMMASLLQGWFSPQIMAASDGALRLAQYHYDSAEARVLHQSEQIAEELLFVSSPAQESHPDRALLGLQGFLESKRLEYDLFEIAVVDSSGSVVARARTAHSSVLHLEPPPPNLAAIKQAATFGTTAQAEQSLNGEFLRGYATMKSSLPVSFLLLLKPALEVGDLPADSFDAIPGTLATLVVTDWVRPELNVILSSVINAFDDYRELRALRQPLQSSYVLTLVIVTLLVLFGAIWIGFYLARTLSVPIQLVAEGTQEVAHGNLDYHIPEVGDDEISVLVRSFNQMTYDLKTTTSELVNAQRMAAWRDVARRIAHEIKNPLTPIQLSAQRILKKLHSASSSIHQVGGMTSQEVESNVSAITECAETILKQVETLRILVNEFSQFARLPKTRPQSSDVNALIVEVAAVFREAHPEVHFRLQLNERIPTFLFDREQMGRVFVNLLENAVQSISSSGTKDREIIVSSQYEDTLSMISVSITDTGIGVPEEDKPRIFEPYFSTRAGGTGLGLAIVSSIVADHDGHIRVRDNLPRGASFVIELPVRQTHNS